MGRSCFSRPLLISFIFVVLQYATHFYVGLLQTSDGREWRGRWSDNKYISYLFLSNLMEGVMTGLPVDFHTTFIVPFLFNKLWHGGICCVFTHLWLDLNNLESGKEKQIYFY